MKWRMVYFLFIDEENPMSKLKNAARSARADDPDRGLRQALSTIADVASRAVGQARYSAGDNNDDDHGHAPGHIGCAVKSLPKRLRLQAAQLSAKINPVNAPAYWRRSAFAEGFLPQPQFIAALTAKYWGPSPRTLTVSFMETTPADLRSRILSHMNAWNKTVGISFRETRDGGQVRISREPGGYWSYLGTDVLLIPSDRQTMNLDGFTMSTRESEYKRVVRHETGHTLGFPHEHMRQAIVDRIDPEKAYAYAAENFGWTRQMVDEQILTSLDERSLMSTPPDQTSIMCYQLPGSITYDGEPILGGTDINANDYAFAGTIYPNVTQAMPLGHVHAPALDDWPESDDVKQFDYAT
jgi:Astacin (Peptidase family M12A)